LWLIAAVVASPKVYTIEIIESLGRQAVHLLNELGYRNVEVRIGDGYDGWPEGAPFDQSSSRRRRRKSRRRRSTSSSAEGAW
jgi:predicted O-methyltransferase YrrM